MKAVSARDAAFLAEMGIAPLWQPRHPAAGAAQDADTVATQEFAGPEEGQEAQAAAPAVAAPPEARSAAPAGKGQTQDQTQDRTQDQTQDRTQDQAAGEDQAIAGMDWTALRAAIASCRRCSACGEGRKPVQGAGASQARWLVVAGASTPADEKAGHPLAGDVGPHALQV